jgi:acyl-CoA thioester hydrolase
MKMVIKASVETVCIVNGRLGVCTLFDEIFAPYLEE